LRAIDLRRQLAKDYPFRQSYRRELANTMNSLASFHFGANDAAAARQEWISAIESWQTLVNENPGSADYRFGLGMSQHNLGWLMKESGELVEGRKTLERSIQSLQMGCAANPNSAEMRNARLNAGWSLAETCLRLRDSEGAAEAARAALRVSPERSETIYKAAAFLAQCAAMQEKGTNSAASYEDETIDLLRKLLRNGFRTRDELLGDPAFSTLGVAERLRDKDPSK
jgi:hypothetical protein